MTAYRGGLPRYGWRAEGNTLVPVAAEQAVAAAIKARVLAGESYGSIARTLASPTRTGGPWYKTTIRRIAES